MATSTPTAEQCEKAREQLAEVEDAIHAYMVGDANARVKFNGKEVESRAANIRDMRMHAADLREIVARCDGCFRPSRRLIVTVPTDCD